MPEMTEAEFEALLAGELAPDPAPTTSPLDNLYAALDPAGHAHGMTDAEISRQRDHLAFILTLRPDDVGLRLEIDQLESELGRRIVAPGRAEAAARRAAELASRVPVPLETRRVDLAGAHPARPIIVAREMAVTYAGESFIAQRGTKLDAATWNLPEHRLRQLLDQSWVYEPSPEATHIAAECPIGDTPAERQRAATRERVRAHRARRAESTEDTP